MKYHIRVCARGLIVHHSCIALNEFDDGAYYNIPGGGVEPGETIKEALIREIKEETGLDIEVGELLFAIEYEPKKCEGLYGDTPKLHLVFRCNPKGNATISPPTVPDVDPINPNTQCNGTKWIPIKELGEVQYLPYIHKQLMEYLNSGIFKPRFFEEPLVRDK